MIDGKDGKDDRSSTAIGFALAYRILGYSFEVALLACLGYWLDLQWKTEPILLLMGVFLGMTLFFLQLKTLIPR